jgi:hypothetical protein
MKAVVLSFLSIIILLFSQPAAAQVMIIKEDSIKIEKKIKKNLKELYKRLHNEDRRSNLKAKSDNLDSLIARDSLNFWALNQKINLQIISFDYDNAEITLEKLHKRSLETEKYDFVKATLFEHFGKHEIADKLYKSEIRQLREMFNSSSSGYKKSESLLGLWYVNRYLGNEAEADSLISVIKSDYYNYINVGVNWNFFSNRFGDGIFKDEERR